MIDEGTRVCATTLPRDLVEISSVHDVRVLQDPKRNHLGRHHSAPFEEWLIKTTQASGLKMGDFGLSERGNGLIANQRAPAESRNSSVL